MKLIVTVQKEQEVTHLHIDAGVRYWEDSEVNGVADEKGELMPFIKETRWCPIIEIESGKVIDWPIGTTAKIHYKICDDGRYSLVYEGITILSFDGYVPEIACPEGEGYGDYIIMNIDENGLIANWSKNPSVTEFMDEDED